MFRAMRKKNRELTGEKAMEILQNCPWGTLSTTGEDGYPYGVPVNYVLMDGAVYIHCAKEGHKLDNIRAHAKVSFCAVECADNMPAKFSTRYASAIAFGRACEVDGDEKTRALLGFIEKYSPEYMESGAAYVQRAADKTHMIRIDIDHISGKASNP